LDFQGIGHREEIRADIRRFGTHIYNNEHIFIWE